MNDDTLTVRYWAGAAAVARCESEVLPCSLLSTVGDVVEEVGRRHPEMQAVLAACTFLHDGHALTRESAVRAGMVVEVLPPFAGG